MKASTIPRVILSLAVLVITFSRLRPPYNFSVSTERYINPNIKDTYNRVQCVFIAFEEPGFEPDDVMDLLRLRQQYFETIEMAYHFDLEQFGIPSNMTQKKLERRLKKLLRSYYLDSGDLLIVFYCGHGSANHGQFRISGLGASYVWEPIRDMICDSVTSDKLFLMDTCNAGAAGSKNSVAMTSEAGTAAHTHEMLVAVPDEELTDITGPDSFTWRLIRILRDMATDPSPLSIKRLQDRFHQDRNDLPLPPHIHLNRNNRCILLEPCHTTIHAWVVENDQWNTGGIPIPKSGCSQLVLVSHETPLSNTRLMDCVYFSRAYVYKDNTLFKKVRQHYIEDFKKGRGTIPKKGLEFRYGRVLLSDEHRVSDLNEIKSHSVDAEYMYDNVHVIQVQVRKSRK